MANKPRKAATTGAAKAPIVVTYILTLDNGDTRLLTIPREWRITYGAGARTPGEQSQFRVYDGTKLLVVWRDVKHITMSGLTIENRTAEKRVLEKLGGGAASMPYDIDSYGRSTVGAVTDAKAGL